MLRARETQPFQLGIDIGWQQQVVGDPGDLLSFAPTHFELRQLAVEGATLVFFVQGHLKGEADGGVHCAYANPGNVRGTVLSPIVGMRSSMPGRRSVISVTADSTVFGLPPA